MRAVRVLLVIVVGSVSGGGRRSVADELDPQIGALARTLERDPSEKARIGAAVALGRLVDGRALAPLMRALGDQSPVVRGIAASALGRLGDPGAISALERALGDPDDGVRARARDALIALRPPPLAPVPTAAAAVPMRVKMAPRESPRRSTLHVVVKPMAVRASAGQHLGGRMRALLVQKLGEEPGLTVDDAGELIVDGTITRLSREQHGPWIETTCEVKLTVSNGGGSLLSIVSGGATVQTARGAWNKSLEPNLQVEALDNAVRGVQANLIGLLARHGGAR